MRRYDLSLSIQRMRVGSIMTVHRRASNFRYGRKAEMCGKPPLFQPWRSSLVDVHASDFCFTPNSRRLNDDVGIHWIYFRCWSESGHGRKALPTDEIDPEPSFTSEPKRSAFRPKRKSMVASGTGANSQFETLSGRWWHQFSRELVSHGVSLRRAGYPNGDILG